VARACARREPLIVLDIPLLYETRGTGRCDFVLVVSAPARLQRERVMRRRGMSAHRFAEILRAQLPDSEKRRRADFCRADRAEQSRDVCAAARHRRRIALWKGAAPEGVWRRRRR